MISGGVHMQKKMYYTLVVTVLKGKAVRYLLTKESYTITITFTLPH